VDALDGSGRLWGSGPVTFRLLGLAKAEQGPLGFDVARMSFCRGLPNERRQGAPLNLDIWKSSIKKRSNQNGMYRELIPFNAGVKKIERPKMHGTL
jgi:hypothetical protein